MTIKDRWLLPEGIEETLPGEARRLESLRRTILDLFERWGYELVMPPLIEFLDALLTGVGRDMDLQTFKVTDQLTGRLMGVRPDMTPQAARIDAHYLKRQQVARLCYLGSVLRTSPEDLAGSREPLQVGAELFGHNGPESDAEVISLMIATLALVGVERPHIDLAHVGVFGGLVAAAGIDAGRKEELLEALQRRARSEAEALLSAWGVVADHRARLLALFDLNGDAGVLRRARGLYASVPAVLTAIDNLEAVAAQVRQQTPSADLHFDLAELAGYHYYTGTMFAAFVPEVGRAIAKGGRYDGIGRTFGRDRAATGFSADLRQLAKIGEPTQAAKPGIFAPAQNDAALVAEIARQRAAGERVVQQLKGDPAVAADYGCDRMLVQKNGKWQIERIKS